MTKNISDITIFQEYIINNNKYRWGGNSYLSPIKYNGDKEQKMIFFEINCNMKIPYINIGLNDQLTFFYNDNNILNNLKSQGIIKYRGYVEYNNIIINWYEIFFESNNVCEHINNSNISWGLVSEIVNDNKIMNKLIADDIIDFFENNREYLFILRDDDDVCESPVVGYDYHDELSYSRILFGPKINKVDPYLGMYYYFYNYEDIMNSGKRGVIYKYILFLEKTCVISENDKKLGIKNDWINDYDSVLISKNKECVYVIKDLEQLQLICYMRT